MGTRIVSTHSTLIDGLKPILRRLGATPNPIFSLATPGRFYNKGNHDGSTTAGRNSGLVLKFTTSSILTNRLLSYKVLAKRGAHTQVI